jgi:hypothetical protein
MSVRCISARIHQIVGGDSLMVTEYITENVRNSRLTGVTQSKQNTTEKALLFDWRTGPTRMGTNMIRVLVSGSITTRLNRTFDTFDRNRLASIAGSVFLHRGRANAYPSAVNTIQAWIIEDIIQPLNDKGFAFAWLHPSVNLIDDERADAYTFTFTMSGPIADRQGLETAFYDPIKLAGLFTRKISSSLKIGDVFDEAYTRLALNPSGSSPWHSALQFPDEANALGAPRYALPIPSGKDSPLIRNRVQTERPPHGYTSAMSQPWAIGMVFQPKTLSTDAILTLFALAGLRVVVEDRRLRLIVGNVVYTYEAALGIAEWTGLAITWNGHQNPQMNAADAKVAYRLRLVDLITGRTSELLAEAFDDGVTLDTMARVEGIHYIGSNGGIADGFRGFVASNVMTTLLANAPLPSESELSTMVRNPSQWSRIYKENQAWRNPSDVYASTETFDTDDNTGTYVWILNGDAVDYGELINFDDLPFRGQTIPGLSGSDPESDVPEKEPEEESIPNWFRIRDDGSILPEGAAEDTNNHPPPASLLSFSSNTSGTIVVFNSDNEAVRIFQWDSSTMPTGNVTLETMVSGPGPIGMDGTRTVRTSLRLVGTSSPGNVNYVYVDMSFLFLVDLFDLSSKAEAFDNLQIGGESILISLLPFGSVSKGAQIATDLPLGP